MARLEWGRIEDKGYTAGVSHGVFFGEDGLGIAWTGLSSVIETPLTNSPETAYDGDNRPYKLIPHTSSKTHKVSCYIYPEEMEDYLGADTPGDSGIILSTRPPKPFTMSYRTETSDEDYEYHILFNQIATFGEINRSTITDRPSPTLFDIRISGTPVPDLGTDHVIIGSDHPEIEMMEKFLLGSDDPEPATLWGFRTGSETISSNINNFLMWFL